jgi:hypothetical protein
MSFPAIFVTNRRHVALCRIHLAIAFLFSAMALPAATLTWIGDIGDSWNSALNWSPEQLPVNTDSLIFTGGNTYTNNDMTTTLLLRHITIDELAEGAFEIDGNAFNIGGTITNQSDYEVTFWGNIGIRAGGGAIPHSRDGTSEGLVVDTANAGVTFAGTVSTDQWSRHLVKQGKGTLTITGTLITNHLVVSEGALHVNGDTLTFFNAQNRGVALGSGWASNAPEEFASATMVFSEGALVEMATPSLMYFSGRNEIRVESDAVLNMTPPAFVVSTTWPPLPPNDDSGRRPQLATVHIDLTQQGSGGMYGGNMGIWGDGLIHVVVSVNTEDGIKTGFGYRATWDTEQGEDPTRVEIATPYMTAYTGGALSDGSNHRRLNGSVNTEQATINVGGLTLTGENGGVLRRNATQVGTIILAAVLMEQGTGDYYIDLTWQPWNAGTAYTRYIHQYSTDGTLFFHRGVSQNTTNRPNLVKTGPGRVVFLSGGDLATPGQLEIQGGEFVLNSTAGVFSYVRSRGEGSVLLGSGVIGGGTYNSEPRHTYVQVFDGGTLDGSRRTVIADNVVQESNALTIYGSLLFLETGQYRVDLLEESGFDPLTVRGTAGTTPMEAKVDLAGNLQLKLEYVPVLGEWIVLLRTDGTINGVFDTVNGDSFIGGSLFQLSYEGSDYWFDILYDADLGDGFTGVVLSHVIPEPATVSMILGVALFGLLYLRRKNR